MGKILDRHRLPQCNLADLVILFLIKEHACPDVILCDQLTLVPVPSPARHEETSFRLAAFHHRIFFLTDRRQNWSLYDSGVISDSGSKDHRSKSLTKVTLDNPVQCSSGMESCDYHSMKCQQRIQTIPHDIRHFKQLQQPFGRVGVTGYRNDKRIGRSESVYSNKTHLLDQTESLSVDVKSKDSFMIVICLEGQGELKDSEGNDLLVIKRRYHYKYIACRFNNLQAMRYILYLILFDTFSNIGKIIFNHISLILKTLTVNQMNKGLMIFAYKDYRHIYYRQLRELSCTFGIKN